MPVTINTGTTVGVSATLPATFDSGGYAVPVITLIGEIVDVGEIAKAFAIVAHQSITRAYPQKMKDTYDIGNVTLTIGKIDADAGQVILQAALASSASYTFKVSLPSNGTVFFTGKIVKAGQGALAAGAVMTTTVDIAIDPESLYEA